MLDRIYWKLGFEPLGIPQMSLKAGWSVLWILHFSIGTIFSIVMANNRYIDSPDGFVLIVFLRSTPRGFRTDFVEKIEKNLLTTIPILDLKALLDRIYAKTWNFISRGSPLRVTHMTLKSFKYVKFSVFNGI